MISAKEARVLHKIGISNRKKLKGPLWSLLEFYVEAAANDGEERYTELYLKDLGKRKGVDDAISRLTVLGYKCKISKDFAGNEYLSIAF